MQKLSAQDLDFRGKRVFLRADFNVPLAPEGRVADDTRIRATLPTMQLILSRGGSIIAASHLGRPRGKPDERFSLRPVAYHLETLLKRRVGFAPDCVGPDAKRMAREIGPGGVLLLENLRFHAEEEKNDEEFAGALASLADVYVNDAFGAAHRAHASTHAIARRMPCAAAGLLMEKEIRFLSGLLENPARPFVAVIGGAKLDTKVDVVRNLLCVADAILVGGAMSYTFFKAQGMPVGASLVQDDLMETAMDVLALAENRGGKLLLPEDHVTAPSLTPGEPSRVSHVSVIYPAWMGVDIGPETADLYRERLAAARTIFWNGPLGVTEVAPFDEGTAAVARAVAETDAVKVAGGGETLAVVAALGLEGRFSHLSTGGGASLEFIAGKKLPGVEALTDKRG
jgi:phosphoglycerate kinase